MNKREEEYKAAERLFQVLSGVDEELLERSERQKKVVPLRRYGGILAASICLCVVGGTLWLNGNTPYSMQDEAADTACEMQAAMAEDDGWPEGMAVMDEADGKTDIDDVQTDSVTGAEGVAESMTGSSVTADDDADTLERASSAADAVMDKQGAVMEQMSGMSEAQAREITLLGNYLPTVIPDGYEFESAYCAGDMEQPESLSVCWSKGADEIWITVICSDTADRDDGAMAVQNLTKEWIEEQMQPVENGLDTDTSEKDFAVLYESGVLVRFSGRGSADSIWKMFQSIEH